MNIKLFTFILLLSATAANAQDQCANVGTKEVALEAIKRELLGASLSEQFKCFTSYDLKHVKAVWNPPNEGFREFEYGVDLDSIKIKSLKLVDEFTGQYNVEFEVKTTERFGSKVMTDKILIATKLSESMHKEYGCAFTMEIPSKSYLAQLCYKEALIEIEKEDAKTKGKSNESSSP